MQEPDPNLVKKPSNQGEQIGLFFLGLFVGGFFELIAGGLGTLTIMNVKHTGPHVLTFLVLLVPVLLTGGGAVLALRRKAMTTAWMLIGMTSGALGPLLVCGGIALSS